MKVKNLLSELKNVKNENAEIIISMLDRDFSSFSFRVDLTNSNIVYLVDDDSVDPITVKELIDYLETVINKEIYVVIDMLEKKYNVFQFHLDPANYEFAYLVNDDCCNEHGVDLVNL